MDNSTTDQQQSPQDQPLASQQPPAIPPQQPSSPPTSDPLQTATSLHLPNTPNSPNPPIQKTHHFPLHKILLIIAIVLTIVFTTAYIGVYYLLNQQLDKLTRANKNPTPPISQASLSPTPTSSFPVQEEITPACTPRPACLDSTPRCMIPETPDMCPKTTPTGVNQTACTLEAKLCSGGTYVSRQPPTCEFAACPN